MTGDGRPCTAAATALRHPAAGGSWARGARSWWFGADAVTVLLLLPVATALGAALGAAPSTWAMWWGTDRGWTMLLQSLAFAAVGAGAATAVGAVIGRGGLGWALVACLPVLVPSALLGSAWVMLLGRSGPLAPAVTVYQWPVAATAVGLRFAGAAAVVVAVTRRPPDPARRVMPVHRGWWWLGVRPALRPLALAWVIVLLLMLGEHVMPSVFLVRTFGTQILVELNALLDPGSAAVLGLLPIVTALVALVGAVALARRPDLPSRTLPSVPSAPEERRPARGARRLAAVVAVLLLLAPVAGLAWRLDGVGRLAEAARTLAPELRQTAVVAGATGVLCAVVGWFLAEGWRACRDAGAWTLVPLAILPAVIPAAVLALGLVTLARAVDLGGADGAPWQVLAGVVRFAPVALLVMALDLRRDDPRSMLAARLHGVTRGSVLRRLAWPSRRRALAAAALLTGLLAASELEMSLLLAPAGATTAAVRLYTLIHTAPDPLVCASALILLLAALPAMLALILLLRHDLLHATPHRVDGSTRRRA